MIRFYSQDNLPSRYGDVVFRQARWTLLLILVISLAAVGGPVAIAYYSKAPCVYLFAVVGIIMPLLLGQIFRRSLLPSNWLMRYRPEGLLIQFRSYLNAHFPPEDTIAFELPAGKIAWIGKTVEGRVWSSGDGTSYQRVSYLDIMPAGVDLSDLKRHLEAERKVQGRTGRYSSSRYLHYPVRVLDNGVIRLDWEGITPGIGKALRILSQSFPVRPDERSRSDLTTPADTLAGMEAQVRQLLDSGEKVSAIRLVRTGRGCSLTEADQFVERIERASQQAE
jgi:hypothetical protein